jgi:hypothetical protein
VHGISWDFRVYSGVTGFTARRRVYLGVIGFRV